mgnify:CR=1 FL=1
MAGKRIESFKPLTSSPRCINSITIYAALMIVRIIKIRFNNDVPNKELLISTSGLIIPKITSTAVTTNKIQKTLQIHHVPDCSDIYFL